MLKPLAVAHERPQARYFQSHKKTSLARNIEPELLDEFHELTRTPAKALGLCQRATGCVCAVLRVAGEGIGALQI